MSILLYIISTDNTLIKYTILYYIHYTFCVEIYENTSDLIVGKNNRVNIS